jgi:CubicO group peptidase (beta-lactamase class C family)
MFRTVDSHFQHTSPELQGMASSAILRFVEELERQVHEIHSFMLLRHGSVIAEGWWSPYRPEHPHMLFSLSKSFTSTAVGLAIAEKHFSIDDAVLSFFPQEMPAEPGDFLAGLRVRHLLSMNTGQAADTWAYMVNRPDGNWIKGFFEVPVVHAPGTYFLYNTGATYMLSAIVQKITGMKLVDYLTPRLFEPLGIEQAAWDESSQGITIGGIGLRIKTEDIARFGQLYLQKGLWRGRRLLSEAWVTEATAAQVPNGNGGQSDWTQGYGYQFWRCRHGAYRGDGVFGQYCIVMPEQDAVLAITGGMEVLDAQQPLDLVWELLLPAMQAAPLPDDSDGQAILAKKLAGLALLPVQGKAASPLASQISGRMYWVGQNERKIETITLDFSEPGCLVRIKTAVGEETLSCGYGVWQPGQTTLFNDAWISGVTPVVASGAWTAEDNFTMIVRLYETPFFHTLVFYFAGYEMLVEARVNVSLEAPRPLLLVANRDKTVMQEK